ncbi:MAG TPA: riboflavin synthase [Candidatus Limnocylindria bacterium]|jgi:riboflavin synthase|nr:riboflavin synthase [Candidatus Limnocylindria bacterium]
MFTGIVEETGLIESIVPQATAIRLGVRAKLCARGTRLGDSMSVNGCCLTVVGIKAIKGGGKRLDFDLLQETWIRTGLSQSRVGSAVNLERALAANGRLGGHFVSGHVDGTGTIVKWERSGQDHILEIRAPKEMLRYVVFKGSIAVDGISLTVAGLTKAGFRLWIIPHTHEVTSLRERKVGDVVNLEADLLGKYVERFMACGVRKA